MTLYRFDQIADLITSRVDPGDTTLDRYVGLEHLDSESLKLRRWGTPSDVIGEKLHFWPGDIIYGKRRAYQRKLAVAEFEGICSAHAMVLRAKADVCLPELLPFFMQSEAFNQRAVEISVGSLSPTINWSALAKQEFPLPPFDEQRRIADLLWAMENSIVQYSLFHKSGIDLLQISINHLTTYGMDSNNKIRNIDLKVNDNGDYQLKNHPNTWNVHRMKDLVGFMLSGLSRAITNEDIGIPVITSTNIANGSLDFSNLKYWYIDDPQGSQTSNYILDDGDILLNFINSIAQIGKSCMFKDIGRPAIYTTNIFRIKPTDLVTNEYLMWLLRSSYVQKWFIKITKPAINQASFTKQDFYRIPVSIPEVNEQKRINFVLKEIEKTIQNTKEHLIHIKNLKKTMLDNFLGSQSPG